MLSLTTPKPLKMNTRVLECPYEWRNEPEAFVLELSASPYRKRDLDVEVCEDLLTIRGSRTWLLRNETTSFELRFPLPEYVDVSATNADYADGKLRVTLPKLPHAQRQRIPINVPKARASDVKTTCAPTSSSWVDRAWLAACSWFGGEREAAPRLVI